MSKTVDERVVEMRFDNKQFESNVQTSMSTIDKLKQSLNLKGASKGLETISDTVKGMSMSALSGAVDTVRDRFSALEVIATTALSNITNSIVDTGRQMLNSLTIAPIKQGFDEYELKMGSVQTIMASTGADLKDVNRYLEELNIYADKTIYSFSDMTASIGKFTNAGVKLDDAVKAIQGISNEAAISGANSQEASRAMYNFAQALSAGSVKLIDWKSIENANMATVEFKQQLIDTAVQLGTLVKVGDKYESTTTDANGNISELFDSTSMFNDSLSSQWMTTDVLIKTLGMYADETTTLGKKAFAAAQDVKTFTQLMDTLQEAVGSGWSTTWEILFGDFEEAKKLWTEVSKVVGGFIDEQSDARNTLLKGWRDLGGRRILIDSLKDAFEGLVSVIKPIKEAFMEIFPPITKHTLLDITDRFRLLAASLKLNDKQSKILKETFKSVFLVVRVVGDAFGQLFKIVKVVKTAFQEVFPIESLGTVKSFADNLKNLIAKFKISYKTLTDIKNIFKGLFAVIDIVARAFGNLFGSVHSVAYSVGDFGSRIISVLGNIGLWLVKLDELDKKHQVIATVINKVTTIVNAAVTIITKIITTLFDLIRKPTKTGALDGLLSVLSTIKEKASQVVDAIGGIFSKTAEAMSGLGGAIANSKLVQVLKHIWETIKTIAGEIGKTLGEMVDNFVKNSNNLGATDIINFFSSLTTLIRFGVLNKMFNKFGDSFKGLSTIIEKFTSLLDKPSEILDSITGVMNGFRGCLESYQKKLKAETLKTIAIAIGILAVSLLIVSMIDKDKMEDATASITMMFIELVAAMAVLSKIAKSGAKLTQLEGALIVMAFSVLILASALKKIGKLDPKQVAVGVAGISVLMYAMVKVIKSLSSTDDKKLTKGISGMILFAFAVKILASAVKSLAELSWEGLAKGLVGVGALMLEISLFLRYTKFDNKTFATALGIVLLSAALKILASVCKDFAQLSWEEIAKGLVGVGVLLGELVIFTRTAKMDNKTITTAIGIILLSAALKILYSVAKDFAQLSWEEMLKGLLGIGVVLAEVTLALNYLPKDVLKKSISMVILSLALKVLASAVKDIAYLGWEGLAISMLGLAGSLGMIVAALELMPQDILTKSAGLFIIATVIKILASVLTKIAHEGWEGMAIGLIGLGGAMTILTASLRGLPKDTEKKAIGVLAMAKAMVEISKALSTLGKLSWQDLLKGLAGVGVSMLLIVYALKEIPTNLKKDQALVLTALGGALEKTAKAMQLLAKLSWEELAKGFIALTAIMTALVYMLDDIAHMDKKAGQIAVILGTVTLAIAKISDVVIKLSKMSWQELVTGLAALIGSVAAIAIALNYMDGTLSGAAALIVAAGAIIILAPALKLLGSLGIIGAISALISLAGAFVILGVAGKFLAPLAPQIRQLSISLMSLSLSLITLNISLMAFGVSLIFIGIGLGEIAAGIVALAPSLLIFATQMVTTAEIILASLDTIVSPLIQKLTDIIIQVVHSLAKIIVEILPDIRRVIKNVLKFILDMVMDILKLSVDYIPTIVGFLVDLIIKVLKAITNRIPELTKAVVDFLMTLFVSIIDTLKSVDPKILEKGIKGLGFITTMMLALAFIAVLVPLALIGVAGIAAVITEMGIALAALGGLAQIPGLKWIIGEGGELLATIGKAIGKFVGGIAGGIMQGVTSSLPTIATDLSRFMTNLEPFINGAKQLDASTMEGVKSLAEAIVLLTGANILDGIASWFGGKNSIADFGNDLADLGEGIVRYYEATKGIDGKAIEASAKAGVALFEMASKIPNSGGLLGKLVGENDIGTISGDLPAFGKALKDYADSVIGLDSKAVVNSADAGTAIFKMAQQIPNSGGWLSAIVGDNSIAKFGLELASFAPDLKKYGKNVKGLNVGEIKKSASAVTSLIGVIKKMPSNQNLNPVKSWFTGEKNLVKFGMELAAFAPDLKKYSDRIKGLDSKLVDTSAKATKTLIDMVNGLPANDKVNPVKSWFTGEKNLVKFGLELASFAPDLKKYSDRIKGLDSKLVTNSANAVSALGDMVHHLPNDASVSSVMSWFSGQKNLVKFGMELAAFAPDLKKYADGIKGVDSKSVESSANAVAALTEIINGLPSNDKLNSVVTFFTGEVNLKKYGEDLAAFAPSIKSFADDVSGIDAKAAEGAAGVAKQMVDVMNALPSDSTLDSVSKWFTGKMTLSTFGSQIANFAPNIKAFAKEVSSIESFDNVDDAVKATSAMIKVANELPKDSIIDTIVKRLGGGQNLEAFGSQLVAFAPSVKSFAEEISGIKDFSNVESAANSAKAMASILNELPANGDFKGLEWILKGDKSLSAFGEELSGFAYYIKSFANEVGEISSLESMGNTTSAVKKIVDMLNLYYNSGHYFSEFGMDLEAYGNNCLNFYKSVKDISYSQLWGVAQGIKSVIDDASGIEKADIPEINKLADALKALANDGVKNFLTAINNKKEDIKKAGVTFVNTFKDGIESKQKDLNSKFTSIIDGILEMMVGKDNGKTAGGKIDKFRDAAKRLADGLIDGINMKSKSVGDKFVWVIGETLRIINAKYMDFFNTGLYLVQGFANGIDQNTYLAQAKAREMAKAATEAARKQLDEHSPSKVFYRIGDFAGLGFVNALGDYADRAYNEGTRIATSAREGLKRAIDKISETVENDIDTQPTIRPVLDLTNISDGTRRLNSLLNSQRTFELASRTGYGFNYAMGNGQMNISVENTDVVDAIGELRDDIRIMADAMGKMRVVMDTGTLVGTLVNPMNSALGQLSVYKKRGI